MKKIGTIDEFPEGRGTKVSVDGIAVAVFNVDGDLYGVSDVCPHRRLPLHRAGWPKHPYSESDDDAETVGDIDGEDLCIRCPWHRMQFDLETGQNPATDAQIATYDVEVEDGDVFVDV
jgi:3-phenylpropionate/trans-cinnamate dioxygenase ferredoxin subunit